MKLITVLLSLFVTQICLSQTKDYAITVKLRGKVEVTIDGKTRVLKKGDKIPAGSVLKSKSKSFAVIKMSDDTKLTLGPSSSIEVQAISAKGKPGLINILKGQLRSKVKPDKIKKGNKLFIKANMAALGVRGTETVITYNPENKSFTTGGLTGEVVISPIENKDINVKDLQKKMNKQKNPKLIKLPKQYFSSIKMDKGLFKISMPQKMNSVQYYALIRNPLPSFNNTKKQLQNLRPSELPNVVPDSDDIIVQLVAVTSTESPTQGNTQDIMPAQVGDNSSVPIAGAIVDFNTGTIINPSATDPVDPVTGMRTPTSNMGTIGSDGSYQAPEGLTLTNNGTFSVEKNYNSDSRSPASIPGIKVAANGDITLPEIPKLEEINIELLDFNDGEAIENQNIQVTQSEPSQSAEASNNESRSNNSTAESSNNTNTQVTENSTGLPNETELGDNIINVENDCPNRKLCDNFNSVSPTTTETITRTAVQFNIIIKK
jgi:hypothetical protein